MGYPTNLITDNTPGVDIYPPQNGQAFGSYTGSPTATASPDHPTWMKRIADEMVAVQAQLGLPSNPASGSILNTLGKTVSEAPTDGQTYGRKSSTWVVVGAGGITEAPTDGKIYGRESSAWALTVPEAPTDGSLYARKSSGWSTVVPGVPEAPTDGQTYGRNNASWAVITGGGGGPVGGSGQTITSFVCIGDSYTDNGNSAALGGSHNYLTQGEQFVSNGPTWFSLLAKIYGFAAVPRWGGSPSGTGIAGGNNYCVAGADVNTSPVYNSIAYDMIYQVTTYLNDVSNAVPAGTLIAIWMGVNDTRNAYGSYKGAHDSNDPLTFTMPAFTMPNPSANTPALAATYAGLVANDLLWIPTAGYMQIVSYSAGALVLQNINSAGNASGGTSIPASSAVRWGAFQFMDSQQSQYTTQVNRMVSAGATKILVLNIPNWGQSGTIGGPTNAAWPQVQNIINYWNSKLATAMGAIAGVTVFDTATLFSNIAASPSNYGIYVTVEGENTEVGAGGSWNQDLYMWYDNLHPSAVTHRILANAVVPFMNKFLGVASQQLALALQTFGSKQVANVAVPDGASFFVPGGNTLALGANPFSQLISNVDTRIDFLNRFMFNRTLYVDIFEDYTGSVTYPNVDNPEGPYHWTYTGAANRRGFYSSPTTLNAQGIRWLNCVSLNDVAGEQIASKAFISPNAGGTACQGQLFMAWRLAHVIDSGSTMFYQFGLMDSLSSPANGIYFEMTDAAGTITATFVELVSGTRRAFSLGTVTWASGGNMTNFQVITDSFWRRFYIYIAGSLVLATGTQSSGPAGNLLASNQVTKQVNGSSGNASMYIDSMFALHLTNRRT